MGLALLLGGNPCRESEFRAWFYHCFKGPCLIFLRSISTTPPRGIANMSFLPRYHPSGVARVPPSLYSGFRPSPQRRVM